MKKLTLIALLSAAILNVAFAEPAKKKMGFAPLSWSSNNTKDMINIQGGSGFGTYYLVQIYVSNMYNGTGPNPSGINIKNCGTITHINPGSTALCLLSYTNAVISFSSDSDEIAAYGLFQISDR